MATSGLGKISDYVDKFDGTRPEEFPTFLEGFKMGARALEIKPDKQYAVMVTQMSGNARSVASKLVDKFITDNPLLETGTAAQRGPLGIQLRDEIITELRKNPLVVGNKPRTTLLARWNKITQGPDETVSEYHHRFNSMQENLAKQEPPVVQDDELVKLTTFVGHTQSTGLRPDLQEYVKLHGGDTVETAVEAAMQFESVQGQRKPAASQVNAINALSYLQGRAQNAMMDYEPRALPNPNIARQQERQQQQRPPRSETNARGRGEKPPRAPPKRVPQEPRRRAQRRMPQGKWKG